MAASKTRGPKYPAIGLEEAIQALHPVFESESRNKMSREVLAMHLGYAGLNGASTSKIGALRHFGLIEGRGDELQVSSNAITLLMRDPEDEEHQKARKEAFLSPSVYQELFDSFETLPSIQNVEFTLVRSGVPKKSASSAAADFVESGLFALAWDHKINSDSSDQAESDDPVADETLERADLDEVSNAQSGISPVSNSNFGLDPGFEEKSGGLLSKVTEYKLFIKGPLGSNELKRLIRKVEIDIEILMDDE